MILCPSPGSDFAKIAQLCRRHMRGLGKPQQAQKSPFSDFQENGFFVFVYTDALLTGNGKQHLDIQMPSLPGVRTEAFCASVYPDALLAGIVKLQSTADGPSLQNKNHLSEVQAVSPFAPIPLLLFRLFPCIIILTDYKLTRFSALQITFFHSAICKHRAVKAQ